MVPYPFLRSLELFQQSFMAQCIFESFAFLITSWRLAIGHYISVQWVSPETVLQCKTEMDFTRGQLILLIFTRLCYTRILRTLSDTKKNPSINYSEWKSLHFPVKFCLLNSLKTTLSSVTFHFIYFISFGSLLIWEWFAHYRCGVTCLRLYMTIQPMNSYNFSSSGKPGIRKRRSMPVDSLNLSTTNGSVIPDNCFCREIT